MFITSTIDTETRILRDVKIVSGIVFMNFVKDYSNHAWYKRTVQVDRCITGSSVSWGRPDVL